LTLLGNVCCVFISWILFTSSIIALLFVHNMLHQLVVIAAFTLFIACILMFVACCRRFEVFAASAAFAAVIVVFVESVDKI
jgi:hypothetical protein